MLGSRKLGTKTDKESATGVERMRPRHGTVPSVNTTPANHGFSIREQINNKNSYNCWP